MKEFKGTKDEWVQGATFFSEEEEQPVYWIDIRVGDNKLAQVNGIHYGISNEECVANAKLMLAAKDLLEALQELWEHTRLNNENASNGIFDRYSLFGKAKAAIDKAL